MSWVERKIGDFAQIKHGFPFESQYFTDAGEFIVLTPGNCHECGGFKEKGEKEKRYSGPVPDGYLLSEGDLLVVMTDLISRAPVLGGSFLVPASSRYLHNQRLGLVQVTRPDLIDRGFLFYLLNSHDYRAQVRGSASGATVRHTSPERIRSCRVRVPQDVREQSTIAGVLSAYDELINNNRRRIALLEEAARLLYREWFVQFRFPGHEHVKVVNGLPDGWGIEPIREAYLGLFDGPHATPAPSQEGPVFLGIQNMREAGGLDLSDIRHVSEADFPRWTRRVVPEEGDIVFSYEATLHRYALVPRDLRCCLGRRMALIRPKTEYRYWLYMHLLERDWRSVVEARLLKGATVDRIPLTTFPTFPVTLPEIRTASAFGLEVEPMFKLIEVLEKKNRSLAMARNLLLPRLMNGEIAV